MLTDEGRAHLERLLALGDRLGRLQRAIDDEMSGRRPEGSARERLRRALEQEAEDGVLDLPLPGTLGRLERRRRFSREEVLTLLLLLSRRVQWGDDGLSGREILEVVFDSSFGILDGCEVLEEGATLRSCGAVSAVEGTESSDVLDTWFVLSERCFRAVRKDLGRGSRKRGARKVPVRPYRDHREHLMDLARLTGWYQRRAMRLFGPPPDMEDGRPLLESVERLLDRVREVEEYIDRRLTATDEAATFPILRLARDNSFSREEMMVLAVLLFQEVYTGTSFLPVVDLVKALANNEEELIEKRALFRRDGALVRSGLVLVEDEPLDRDFSSEAMIPSWVVDELLGSSGKPGITSEARRDFAAYLSRLKDSGQFFRDLGEPDGEGKDDAQRRSNRRGGRKDRGDRGRGGRGGGRSGPPPPPA
jgi:hypothetical protein